MGGIEVSRNWRGNGIGRALLRAVFKPDAFPDDIIIATGYRWCWDLESAGMAVREYREMLNRIGCSGQPLPILAHLNPDSLSRILASGQNCAILHASSNGLQMVV